MRNPLLHAVALALLILAPCSVTAAVVIADVSTADCTRTRVTLELLGAPQLPVSLGVRLTPSRDTALPAMTTIATRGTDGRYFTPALLLPLGEYRVEALDPVTQEMIAFDVLNTATIATIRARASLRTPVQVRRAPRLADTKREVASLQLRPSYDRGVTSAHIILVDDAGVFLDQYFGKPVPVWQSRPLSSYNVYAFGAQYFADGRCQPMPLRSAE